MVEIDDNSFLPRQYCFSLHANTFTEIDNIADELTPLLWPNPSSGQVFINSQSNVHIEFFDVNGRLVFKNHSGNQLSLPKHMKGLYFYTIHTPKQVKKGKLMVY